MSENLSSRQKVKCPKCKKPMEIEKQWAPNELDRRMYGECSNCGFETDDEFDVYLIPDKEVLIAEADGSRYIHGEGYEVTFDFEHWSTSIATKHSWEGKVKITIEPFDFSNDTVKEELK